MLSSTYTSQVCNSQHSSRVPFSVMYRDSCTFDIWTQQNFLCHRCPADIVYEAFILKKVFCFVLFLMSIILIRLGVSGGTGALAGTSLWIGMISRCDSLGPNTSHISFLEPVLLIISIQEHLSNSCFPALLLRYSGKKKKKKTAWACAQVTGQELCAQRLPGRWLLFRFWLTI